VRHASLPKSNVIFSARVRDAEKEKPLIYAEIQLLKTQSLKNSLNTETDLFRQFVRNARSQRPRVIEDVLVQDVCDWEKGNCANLNRICLLKKREKKARF
jgi:hypothetical protein